MHPRFGSQQQHERSPLCDAEQTGWNPFVSLGSPFLPCSTPPGPACLSGPLCNPTHRADDRLPAQRPPSAPDAERRLRARGSARRETEQLPRWQHRGSLLPCREAPALEKPGSEGKRAPHLGLAPTPANCPAPSGRPCPDTQQYFRVSEEEVTLCFCFLLRLPLATSCETASEIYPLGAARLTHSAFREWLLSAIRLN